MSFEQSCIKQIKNTKLITLPTKDIIIVVIIIAISDN